MKLIKKKQILCIKLVEYWDKYTEMHGQQNVKKKFLRVSDFIDPWSGITQLYRTLG